MKEQILCPHCKADPADIVVDYTDWCYQNNLYDVTYTANVICPNCSKHFFVKPYTSFVYETAVDKDDL